MSQIWAPSNPFPLANAVYATGLKTTAVVVNLIGVNAANLVSIDPAGIGVVFGGGVTAASSVFAGDGTQIGWTNRVRMVSANTNITFYSNSSLNDMGLVQLGGNTNSYPAIKRNAASIDFRLADDSNYTAITASSMNVPAGGFFQFLTRSYFESVVDGNLTLRNQAGSNWGLLQLGGTTSSYPAIKRNAAGIDFRVGDDSAYAVITVLSVTVSSAAFLISSNVGLTNNAAAQVATMTNGPTAGNPTKWIPINDNGTTRNIPAW